MTMTANGIQGVCDTRFEAVREEFERNFTERGEVGAALHITLDGQPVVDLWGGVADQETGRPWDENTRAVVYSSTKGVTAICAHVLVDRGELDLDAPVKKYWPEFATNGKEDTTVAMMLSHQAGVPAFREPLQPLDMTDWEKMCTLLARQEPYWKPGTRNGYHMVSFGWVVGELVRRVSGMSLGTFLRREIADPRNIDFHIGLPEELEPTVAPIIAHVPGAEYESDFARAIIEEPTSVSARSALDTIDAGLDFNVRENRAAEIGGGGGVGTACGLAQLYTPLANGGGGLVSPDTVTRMSEIAAATASDETLRIGTRFALGFMKSIDNRANGQSGMSVLMGPSAFGHVGSGGSLGFADPTERIGFGYVMNRQGAGVLMNDRGQSLVDRLYESLGYRTNAPGVWTR
ncbi:serine hydrolase domain-containing protein [Brevibacterium yomogidense]|uniref:Beta-lactamase class C and other penicillin binding proteins n=1 Tax=Brevibacterium yomogidense TaxID=946573 RepID=A0A1X6XAB8_9MICO|nr:serine hydrolase domain-containing protein [Brevibacterium yomogidense]SLM96126.1 Beta-lactamase class C and other penicillin binding proteins [Brevibacterium yomogidense]